MVINIIISSFLRKLFEISLQVELKMKNKWIGLMMDRVKRYVCEEMGKIIDYSQSYHW